MQQRVEEFRRAYGKIHREITKVIVGHADTVHGILTCLFVGGHALLEGVPGLGKTLLVRTLSQVLDLAFNRIQFTPDLMPSDILGTNIISETGDGRRAFTFQPGPLFAQIVLADEINRATPKTQSALLEAMQEHSITIGGTIHKLQEPFFVMATQNPIEQEGTYPLPEAQLDRFFFKLLVTYAGRDEMATILDRTTAGEFPTPECVMDGERFAAGRRWCARCWWPNRCKTTPSVWCWRRIPAANSRRGRRTSTFASEPVRAAPGADPGVEGAGAHGRAVQYQLRGHSPCVSARTATSHSTELRGPGRKHPAGRGVASDRERSERNCGRRTEGIRGFTTKAQRTQRKTEGRTAMKEIDSHTPEMKERANQLSKGVIGAAIEVHRHLGPGLLESAYEACLEYELKSCGFRVERQVPLPIVYKGLPIDEAYRIDLLVEDILVLELKAVAAIDGIHEAQLITYLRLSKRWLGLLMNFNTIVLTKGIKRFVNG